MGKNTAHKFNKVAKIYNTPIFQLYYLWAHKACINFLKDYVKDKFKVLDVACGTGIFLRKIDKHYKGLELFGIDNSKEMISIANQYPDVINFMVASADKIPFENNSFDLITIIDAFYYFQDKEAVLKECFRILKPNHSLLIFYPAIDIFPKFILEQIKFFSRLFLMNLEEYSDFIKVKPLKNMAIATNFASVEEKTKLIHRFFIFIKNENTNKKTCA
jgi:ubiquinone/menaquinone biosynthesis C-methylase UbiE